MKAKTKLGLIGLILGIAAMVTGPVYAGFGNGPVHTHGPMYGDIADFELITFDGTVDYVQPPILIVTDEQTIQWTMYAGNAFYWEDQGYAMEVGDSVTVVGAAVMYNTGLGGGGMHGGGGFTSDGTSTHFVLFSVDDHSTGQTMQFRDPDTGVPLWSHFGAQ